MDQYISPENAPDIAIDWTKVDRAFDNHCAALGISRDSAAKAAGVSRTEAHFLRHDSMDHPARVLIRIAIWCDVNPLSFCKVDR